MIDTFSTPQAWPELLPGVLLRVSLRAQRSRGEIYIPYHTRYTSRFHVVQTTLQLTVSPAVRALTFPSYRYSYEWNLLWATPRCYSSPGARMYHLHHRPYFYGKSFFAAHFVGDAVDAVVVDAAAVDVVSAFVVGVAFAVVAEIRVVAFGAEASNTAVAERHSEAVAMATNSSYHCHHTNHS